MSGARAIKTRYRGMQFRSKLEAEWALSFDNLGIPWEYEREGELFGSVFYYVDFWLPRSRQYVEVKGPRETAEDRRKWRALITHTPARPFTNDSSIPDLPLIIAWPDGRLGSFLRFGDQCRDDAQWLKSRAIPPDLSKCRSCGGWWFHDPDMVASCQCCGEGVWDREQSHIAERFSSAIPFWPHVSIHQESR